MKANFNRLIDGADGAAEMTLTSLRNASPDLAVLISCVGRKLVLKVRAEEALVQSNQKWEAIISASPDSIGMVTMDAKFAPVREVSNHVWLFR